MRFDGVDTSATLARVIAAIQRLRLRPDAVLVTGDLVHDPAAAAYLRLRRQLEGLDLPVYCLPGNHDDPGMMRTCLGPSRIGVGGIVDAGGWRLVLLNSWIHGSNGGRLAQTELDFLCQAVEETRERFHLVALHHPPVSIGSPWMDAMGLQDPEGLLEIIDRRSSIRAVIWGHIHQAFSTRRGGAALLGTPSTCIQFTPGSDRYRPDHRPPAFRDLWLHADGTVESRVVWVRG